MLSTFKPGDFLWLENILYLKAQFTATSSILTIFYVLSHNLVYVYLKNHLQWEKYIEYYSVITTCITGAT